MFGPVPSNDVIAAGCRVGAVDVELTVDALRGTVVGEVDEPKRFESAIKCPTTHPLLLSEFRQRRCRNDIGHEVFKIAGLRAIGAGSCYGATAVRVFAPPPSCAFGCGSVFLRLPRTYRASWSAFTYPESTPTPD